MTSKGLALLTACAMVVSACGGVARPQARATQPEPVAVESSTTSSSVPDTTAVPSAPQAESDEPPAKPVGSSPSSPSTTLADPSPTSTTTNPAESIDLAPVHDALDALDELLGGLDSHIGSVDLDEGETP